MKNVAFFDVDTQFDFMDPAGALHVPGAEELALNLRRLTAFARARGIPLVSSADAHGPDDPEFRVFPPHCVKGTPGAERIAETRLEGAAVVPAEAPAGFRPAARRGVPVVIEKRTYDVFSNRASSGVLRAVGARHWAVYGVATDYCVRAAALGLRRRGYAVTVVEDAIRPVSAATGAKALDAMRRAGCRFAGTEALLAALGARPGRAARKERVVRAKRSRGIKPASGGNPNIKHRNPEASMADEK